MVVEEGLFGAKACWVRNGLGRVGRAGVRGDWRSGGWEDGRAVLGKILGEVKKLRS